MMFNQKRKNKKFPFEPPPPAYWVSKHGKKITYTEELQGF